MTEYDVHEMYKNKDTYAVVHSGDSDTYNLYIDSSEQSGIINFLNNLLASKN